MNDLNNLNNLNTNNQNAIDLASQSNNDQSDQPSQLGYQLVSIFYLILGILLITIVLVPDSNSSEKNPLPFIIGLILMILGISVLIYLHVKDSGTNIQIAQANSVAKNILFIPLYVGISGVILTTFTCFMANKYNIKFLLGICPKD